MLGQPIYKNNWTAKWVAAPQQAQPNTFWKFKKSFKLLQTPQTAILNIATDSKYWLYINQKLVVFEGQLKRGPTPKDTYFDTVDIIAAAKQV
jgi:alpha-L-rhamnosidase